MSPRPRISFCFAMAIVAAADAQVAAQCSTQWLGGQVVPGTDGPIRATTTWDPDGAGPLQPVVVIGGAFQVAGSVFAPNIATYDAASGVCSALGSGMSGYVNALTTLPNGDLVAGGSFTFAGGVSAARRTDVEVRCADAPMLSRNPVLHYVFAAMELAEERGLGLKSMRSKAGAAGLPLPSYSYRAPYLTLTLYREAKAAIPSGGKDIAGRLSEAERTGWNWLATRETVRVSDYARAMQVPGRTATYHLRRMTALGLLRRVGAGRATRYEVVRS